MKRLFVFIGMLSLSTSCITFVMGDRVVGEGPSVTEKRSYDAEICGVGVASGVDLILDDSVEQGELLITTAQNIMEYVEIEKQGDTLNIGLRSGVSYKVDEIEVRMSPDNLNTFAASGGSDVSACQELHFDSNITIAASGGADVSLRGSCRDLMVAVSGGADVDLGDMRAERVSAAASGGADLEVYATVAYDINASGGADVEYRATSATTNIHSSGGADIRAI